MFENANEMKSDFWWPLSMQHQGILCSLLRKWYTTVLGQTTEGCKRKSWINQVVL